MPLSLKKIQEAHERLKEYSGDNPYLAKLRNDVFAYNSKTLNDFECTYILGNYNNKPKRIFKTVKVADWWGQLKQQEWKTEFTPDRIVITWLLGETDTVYHFFCMYRRSQPSAVECFAPKKAILTDFLLPSFNDIDIDFSAYAAKSGRELYPYQEEAVKFLVARKKAILASEMGCGKTSSAIVASLCGGYERILVIAPASVKTSWKKELGLYVDEDDITVVSGRKWDNKKYTIINYDILKNFYEVPTEVVKEKTLILNDQGRLELETKDREKVSRKKSTIKEAMDASDIYNAKFDLIIIDEAHRLSNTTSGIYKIVSDFVKRSNPKGIFALTGTPITNRPINFYNILKIIGAPIADDWTHYVERYCDGKSFYKKKERDAQTYIYLRNVHKNSWYDLTFDEKKELDTIIEQRCKKVWVTNGASNLEELQEIVKPYYLRRMKSEFGTLPNKVVKVLAYSLTDNESREYEDLWEEYINGKDSEKAAILEKYRHIAETTKERQWLANSMIERTANLARRCIESGHKVVIFCSFDDEINTLSKMFGDICVKHNGKTTAQKKDKAVDRFQNDDSVKVFLGNIQSASVGITLTRGTVAIFNSFSWVSGINLQAEDRIHRIGQQNDVTVYYQVFKDTFYEDMLDKVRGKEDIISTIIIDESKK